jgi:hypothetical protein
MMRLTDKQLQDVLARAEELDRAANQPPSSSSDLAAFLGAAEEVGFSRQAVQQALAEQLDLPAAPPVVGALIWARAADGEFYVAEVLSSSEYTTQVRFLGGSEHALPLDELRSCALSPGARVVCNWPNWGKWTCTVMAYDSGKGRVKLSDGWGSTKWFPISEIWMARPKDATSHRRRLDAILIGAGAVLGSLITALLMR